MKEHNPMWLIGGIGGIILLYFSFLLGMSIISIIAIPMCFCLIPYLTFVKIIPCPICKQEDRVILSDYIGEIYGSDEKINNLNMQQGVMFCKRCEYKFGYGVPMK